MSTLIKESTIRKVLVVYYSVGLAGFVIPATYSLFVKLIPFTLLMNVAVMLWYQKGWSINLFLSFFFIAVAGFGIEWIGVQTGLIFGNYTYTNVLGPRIGGTPPIIGINWLILVLGSFYLLKSVKINMVLICLLAALLMTGYDWILEPIAVRLHMWHWAGNHVPIQNYAAWFIVSFTFLYFHGQAASNTRNSMAGFVFISQLLFFVTLRIFMTIHLF